MKRIRTVLYGDQAVSLAELEVLHTPSLQRLYGLKQLGLTDRVFIDASHSRLHHVVGVLAQVDRLVSAIVKNLNRRPIDFRIGVKAVHKTISSREVAKDLEKRRQVVRFIGFLHDLTHAPFGHTVEDEIGVLESKHDEPKRQADAFYRLICQLSGWLAVEAGRGPELPEGVRVFLGGGHRNECPDADEVAKLIATLISAVPDEVAAASWRLSKSEIPVLFAQLDSAMSALLHLEVLHADKIDKKIVPDKEPYPFQVAIRKGLSSAGLSGILDEWKFDVRRDAYMLDIVGNTVCADLLDYARRDSHYCGLRLSYDPERASENFTLISWDASRYDFEKGQPHSKEKDCEDPFEGWCLRTAISLVSHKYRADVPGELMNLLNTRFHLYERAIFHPTKCASGAMLGTALQLIGWRKSTGLAFPTHLRFLGDDVFLHELREVLALLQFKLNTLSPSTPIDEQVIRTWPELGIVHGQLGLDLLNSRKGDAAADVLLTFRAASDILNRVISRRFARPVFRVLPSSRDPKLGAGAETMSDMFIVADKRFSAEREIEKIAGLPQGSVFIHCPRRQTAKKVANVLLVQRKKNEAERVCKLRHISQLDADLFGQHEAAVQAVEQMYRSMWRLVVYVNPEHLGKVADISQAAGKVLFRALDVHGQFENDPDAQWKNDPHLEEEISQRLNDADGFPDVSARKRIIEAISDELDGGSTPALSALVDRVARENLDGAQVRGAVADLMKGGEATQPADASDLSALVEAALTYFEVRPSPGRIKGLQARYERPFRAASPEVRTRVVEQLRQRIADTPAGLAQHRGTKMNEIVNTIDAICRDNGIAPDPNAGLDLLRRRKDEE